MSRGSPTYEQNIKLVSHDAGNTLHLGVDDKLFVKQSHGNGTPGPPGPAAVIAGSVATVGDLPSSGRPGQYYIVQADGDLYAWSE